jgi:Tfp pilus assembly protein PilX
MIKDNEKGYILITSMLMLLVLTVIGLAAINTSTIENKLSGNMRLRERNVSKADGGLGISNKIIEHLVREGDQTGFADIIGDATLETELRSVSFDCDTNEDANPDVSYAVDDAAANNVNVDIDKMYNTWGNDAIEFAAGYEGLGKGGASGFRVFYRINASSSGLASSAAEVGSIYRYIPK